MFHHESLLGLVAWASARSDGFSRRPSRHRIATPECYDSPMFRSALFLLTLPLSAQSLLLISIDGMRPDYVLKADEHGLKIPHLRRLLKDGAHATGALLSAGNDFILKHFTNFVLLEGGGRFFSKLDAAKHVVSATGLR